MPADPMRPAGLARPGQQLGGLPATQARQTRPGTSPPAWEREDWDPEGGGPAGRGPHSGADNWDPEDWYPVDWDLADGELAGRDRRPDADGWDPDEGAPPAGAVFAQGAWGDGLAPDPVLASLLDLAQRDGLQLDDDQLTGVLQAASRLAAWSASLKLAATSRLAARREAEGNKSGDWRPFDHVDDEVAVALTLTRRSAGRLLDLALSLERLPLARAALSGRADRRAARRGHHRGTARPGRRARRRGGETDHREGARADHGAVAGPGPPRGPVRGPGGGAQAQGAGAAGCAGGGVHRARRDRRALRAGPVPGRCAGRRQVPDRAGPGDEGRRDHRHHGRLTRARLPAPFVRPARQHPARPRPPHSLSQRRRQPRPGRPATGPRGPGRRVLPRATRPQPRELPRRPRHPQPRAARHASA